MDRVRDGRTYTTRAVRAVQNGRTVFVMLCSFQKPELDQPNYQWTMPLNVPRPENCNYSYARALKTTQDPNVHEEVKSYLSEYVQVKSRAIIPVDIMHTLIGMFYPSGTRTKSVRDQGSWSAGQRERNQILYVLVQSQRCT